MHDPDNGDVACGTGDVLTIRFDRPTDAPPAASRVEIDRLLAFNQALGEHYTGAWADGATLVVHAGIDDDLTVAKLDGVQRSLFTLMRRHVTSPPAVFLPPVHRCSARSSR